MSSKTEKKEKELLMEKYWKSFGDRLAQFVPEEKINEFAIKNGLSGFRLDRVVQGKKGVDVQTLLHICTKLDISPTWLLLGRGRTRLSSIAPQAAKRRAATRLAEDDPHHSEER